MIRGSCLLRLTRFSVDIWGQVFKGRRCEKRLGLRWLVLHAERHGRPLRSGASEVLLLVLDVPRVRSGHTWSCKGERMVMVEALSMGCNRRF
jgi:hypothetical protein